MIDENKEKPILFGPKTGKSLIRLYPELANEQAFKDIPLEDLNFAWYVGNPSSPIDPEWEDMIKYKTAAAVCFSNNDTKRKLYGSGEIPDAVRQAIEKMQKYSPQARMVAKRMTQKMFEKLEQMVDVDMEEFVTVRDIKDPADPSQKIQVREIDWTGRKQYVDSMAKISETLPTLIKQIEEGFGMTDHKKNNHEEGVGTRAIERYHKSKKE